jgi:hypothetical protein
MAKFAISKPAVRVNNNPVGIVPNSCKFDEGEGETNIRTASTGGGGVSLIISDNAEDKIGTISFDLPNTIENIELARGWKKNPGANFVEVSGEVGGETFSRVFNAASITNNYEVELSSDGKLSLEWKSEQPL